MRAFLFVLAFYSTFSGLFAETRKHPSKPIGSIHPGVVHRGNLPEQTVRISGLKAVMLGGNVDGIEGATTVSYRGYLKRVAAVLRARGVQVTEIYSPTKKETIAAAISGAHFIFYAGHGIGSSEPPRYQGDITPAGMLVVDEVWSNAEDVAQWKPAPGAIVFFLGACFTAGNSGDDIGKIQDAEAKRRIGVYSAPFFLRNRFGAYYAAWSDSAAQDVMAELFAGRTLGQAYDPDGNMSGVFKSQHPNVSSSELWYHRSNYDNRGYAFDYAFVGKPGMTLEQLFKDTSQTTTTTTTTTPTTNENKIDPEEAKRKGTELIRAIYDGQDASAIRLINEGADTNVRYSQWTPLMLAVYYDRPSVVRALISVRADLNAMMDTWTALSLSDAYGRTEISGLLRAAGAKTERAMPGTRPLAPPRR